MHKSPITNGYRQHSMVYGDYGLFVGGENMGFGFGDCKRGSRNDDLLIIIAIILLLIVLASNGGFKLFETAE